jgi:MFS family permease
MNFKKVNNLTGWIICAIACIVYIATAEASASFWDTGEFIASAYKLQLPHPPGAPLFTLLGRFFIVLFGGDNPAFAVNIMSALASGFTILFLFWTITHFARKLMVGSMAEPSFPQTLTIVASGIVGALAYTFSDSFWFSAVEGEVYALSSFFTALVFWAMLKWERADDNAGTDVVLRARADRWIVFIFFMMGLSVGVHLLNLLTIPALVMIYYYKRHAYSRKGAIWAFIIGCIITGVVQVAVIQWTVKYAGKFDIWFVNSLDLPFFSGFLFFFILLSAAVWFGLRYANRNGLHFLRLGLWCFIFMMLGYSTYVTTIQRSNANPAIDMNNVDNPMSLVYYLGREQYGTQPLLYGPHFSAEYERDETTGQVQVKEGEMKYTKGKNKYIEIGRAQDPQFKSSDKQLFVRVWDRTNEQDHADFYADWLGLEKTQNQQTGETTYEAPTYGDNINWFVTYQMGHMYWRYFMWNFAGKQNDIQGFGNKRDGNWISGIPFMDNVRLGDQAKMPDSIKHNKANNKLFLLPFILGIFGCVYHFLKDRKDWIVTFLLFFFTGLAVVLYLNQPGNQPRERDYAFVGSFYAFAVWIGLSVVGFVRLAREKEERDLFRATLIYGSVASFVITLLSNTTTTPGAAIGSALIAAVVYAAVVALVGFIVGAASKKGENIRSATITTFAICMIVPLLMAFEVWNDHDRSEKTLAPSMAKNYLESCAPNAVLFTFGDNDTYPLWYAQEVEGVRPDIRIINSSLLGIDWYVNMLRYKINESAPIDVIWSPEQVSGLSYITFRPQGAQDKAYPLYDIMKEVIGPMLNSEDKANVQATFPVRKFFIPVNGAELAKYGTVNPTDTALTQMPIDLPEGRNYLTLDQLTILNIIAANNWKRPIYFTSPYNELGFGQYLRKDGLTYRLVPVQNNFPQQNWLVDQALRGTSIRDNNTDVMYKNLMKFTTGGANNAGVYFDEENRRHLLSVRSTFAELAGNMADKGRKAEGAQLLDKAESLIATVNMPYAMVSRYNSHNQTALIYLEAAYKAGHTQLVNKLKAAIRKDLTDQKAYYDYLRNEKEAFYNSVTREAEINEFMIQLLDGVEKQYSTPPPQVQEQPRRAADSTARPAAPIR